MYVGNKDIQLRICFKVKNEMAILTFAAYLVLSINETNTPNLFYKKRRPPNSWESLAQKSNLNFFLPKYLTGIATAS